MIGCLPTQAIAFEWKPGFTHIYIRQRSRGGNVTPAVSLSVCCYQTISESYWRIWTKFCGMIDLQPLDFRTDPDPDLDSVSFFFHFPSLRVLGIKYELKELRMNVYDTFGERSLQITNGVGGGVDIDVSFGSIFTQSCSLSRPRSRMSHSISWRIHRFWSFCYRNKATTFSVKSLMTSLLTILFWNEGLSFYCPDSFVYATHTTQAIAFEWKPGLRLLVL